MLGKRDQSLVPPCAHIAGVYHWARGRGPTRLAADVAEWREWVALYRRVVLSP